MPASSSRPAFRRAAGAWGPLAGLLLLLQLLAQAPLLARGQPDLGTCYPEGSSPATPNNVTQACACIDGWTGPECAVCTQPAACRALQNYTGPLPTGRLTCDRSLEIIERAQGFCRVATQGVNDFLKGQAYITAQLSVAGEMHFEFIKTTGADASAYTTMFKCDGSECKQTKDPKSGRVQTLCPTAHCNMTCEVGGPDEACTEFVASQIAQIGKKGPLSMVCDDPLAPGVDRNGTTCVVHENLLDFYFKGVALDQCFFGECAPEGARSNVQQGSLAEFAQKNAAIFEEWTYILAGAFGVVVLLVISLGLLLYYALSGYHSLESCAAIVAGAGLPPITPVRAETTLCFQNIGYALKGRQILQGITGVAPGGEILAIMGPSGCGKSTLMDILSMKNKSGRVSGRISVNGQPLTASFKRQIGFVDQHDVLMPTLTVVETIMFSALLRLPKTLTMAEKTQRVLSVLHELQLAHIADSKVGNEVTRGISGGEKRRVSVGMELVTQPKALFLDEPTSGLDTYNADLLVQILLDLAQARGTAVILTVHQPRENIFARFNRLLLICQGERVFYGSSRDVHAYFASIGKPIPPAYNPADYLIDILFTHEEDGEEEMVVDAAAALENGAATANPVVAKVGGSEGGVDGAGGEEGGKPSLAALFAASAFAGQVEKEVGGLNGSSNVKRQGSGEEAAVNRGRSPLLLVKKASSLKIGGDAEAEARKDKEARVSWLVEVSVVSQRMFKDMVRKPGLIVTHMVACLYYGVLLGALYFQTGTSGISAVQNRLGLFMLEALFLAFTSVSALPLFWLERPLYVHEHSNRYYGPSSYFVAKIFSDIIPLRVLPPILLAVTTHLLAGLRGGMHFFTYTLVLVMLTTIAATLNLIIGMLTRSIMSGILVATIIMIHLILLTTIFVNFDTMKVAFFRGLRYLSFFNYGYEALVVNELAGRTITDFTMTEGSVILRSLGFHVESLSFNTFMLFAYLIIITLAAYLVLRYCVRERR